MLGAYSGPLGSLQLGQIFVQVETPEGEPAVIAGYAAYVDALLGSASVDGTVRGRGSVEGDVTGFGSAEE